MTLTIFLVDDSVTFLGAVRHFLDLLPGLVVVGQAHNGHDAVPLIQQLRPDLVLLDIAMPEMNGLELARTLQSWPQAPHIVFLSMHDNPAYREAASELGVFGFVGKADFVTELLPLIDGLALNPTTPPMFERP